MGNSNNEFKSKRENFDKLFRKYSFASKDIDGRYLRAREYVFSHQKNNIVFYISVFFICFFATFFGFLVGEHILPKTAIDLGGLATVLGVLGAAVVSLIVAEKNRENEINKHREKWCSDLRNNFSDFSASVNNISRIAFEGVNVGGQDVVKSTLKMYENLKSNSQEINNFNKIHHSLALYLISRKMKSPKQLVFKSIEDYSNSLRISISNIYNIGSQIDVNNVTIIDCHDCDDEINQFKSIINESLVDVSYDIKVYLDHEWDKVNSRNDYNRLFRVFLFSCLMFLVISFCTYVLEVGAS